MQPTCDQPDERPSVVKDVHYLYFSMILSSVTLVTLTAISLLTEPPSKEMVRFCGHPYPLRCVVPSELSQEA